MSYRFRVRKDGETWNIWLEGPVDRWLAKAESVSRMPNVGNTPHIQWIGQIHADSLKLALVRLQHLIPELQE